MAPSLWSQIARQTLLGKRGISKTGTLWLPIAAILSAAPSPGAWAACLLLFAASACRTQALILANDVADRAEDRAAGKDRWILRLRPAAGVAVVLGLLGVGAGIFLAARAFGALVVYAAAVALGLAYSLRPGRLKERGLVGLVDYSACCALAYVAVPWAWLGGGWMALAVLSAAVFLDRWVNLHFHQVIDFEADARGGIRTYAIRVGLDRARRTLRWAAGLASAALAGVLVLLAVRLPATALPLIGIGAAAAAAAGLHARAARSGHRASSLVREVPWHYLGLTFAVFRLLPPLLFARLAIGDPTLWVPTAAAVLTLLLESGLSLRYRYQ